MLYLYHNPVRLPVYKFAGKRNFFMATQVGSTWCDVWGSWWSMLEVSVGFCCLKWLHFLYFHTMALNSQQKAYLWLWWRGWWRRGRTGLEDSLCLVFRSKNHFSQTYIFAESWRVDCRWSFGDSYWSRYPWFNIPVVRSGAHDWIRGACCLNA